VKRRRWLLLLAALLTLGLVGLARLPSWSRGFLASRLSAFFHRPVTIGEVRVHVLPASVEIEGLSVGGMTPEAPPFLEVSRVEVVPSLGTFFSSRIALSRVRLENLKVRVNGFPEPPGGDDIPRMGGEGAPGSGGSSGTDVRLRRLVIEGGEFILNHARIPLDLDLPDFHGRLARQGQALGGTVSFGSGRMRVGSAALLSASTEINLRIEGSLLKVDASHLRTAKADIGFSGEIRIAQDPIGQFDVDGPVDLDELDRGVMETGFGIRGDAHFRGVVTVNGPRLRLRGSFRGTSGVFDAVPVPRYSGVIAWNETGVHLRSLEVLTLDGRGVLDLEIPPDEGVVHLQGHAEGLDFERTLIPIFEMGAVGVGASATGPIDLSWPKGRFRDLSGRIELELATKEGPRTPLWGRLLWRAEKGVQFLEGTDLRTPTTQVRLSGRIERNDQTDMSVDGESSDLVATDTLGVQLRKALGTRDATPAGLSGEGVFRGRWKGTLQVPVFEGRFSGQEVGYLGVLWGQVEWAGRLDPFEVESHSLVLRRAGGDLWLDGKTETGETKGKDAVDVRVRFREWPAADWRSDGDRTKERALRFCESDERRGPLLRDSLWGP